jgi:hypothetical protein
VCAVLSAAWCGIVSHLSLDLLLLLLRSSFDTFYVQPPALQAIKAFQAGELNGEILEQSVVWWNSCKQPMFHYRVAKGTDTVSGVIRAKCQASDGAHVTEKKVRMDSGIRGLQLVELLASKITF